jgi:hypothetical protein
MTASREAGELTRTRRCGVRASRVSATLACRCPDGGLGGRLRCFPGWRPGDCGPVVTGSSGLTFPKLFALMTPGSVQDPRTRKQVKSLWIITRVIHSFRK